MPNQHQQVLTLLFLASVAALLLMATRQPQPPRPAPPPPGEPPPEGPPPPPGEVPQYPPLTPEQIAAYRGNGSRSRVTAVPYYSNEERWELRRDKTGRLTEIVVHRDARVQG